MWVSDRRLYLDKHGKAVEADDPRAAELLCGHSDPIPWQQARDLGLVDKDGNTLPPKEKPAGKAKDQ